MGLCASEPLAAVRVKDIACERSHGQRSERADDRTPGHGKGGHYLGRSERYTVPILGRAREVHSESKQASCRIEQELDGAIIVHVHSATRGRSRVLD